MRTPLIRAALLGVATTFALAAPAAALNCGGAGQPACLETPPPGVELKLSSAENPYRLKPVSEPSADGSRRLWPEVRGHKPYGFNAIGARRPENSVAEEAGLHRAMGASIARVFADWAMIQYYPGQSAGGPGWTYSWYLDPYYREYIRRGVRPLLTIGRTPRRWTINATTAPNSSVPGCGTSDACWNPPRPEDLDRLKTFAADLAKRYPLAAGIEVWNEPNLSNPFWGTQPADPEHYTAMLRTVHDAVNAVRPNLPVLGGALGNIGSDSDADLSDATYLQRMLQAGAGAEMDAVSHHPYLGPFPWHVPADQRYDEMVGRIVRNGRVLQETYAAAGVPMTDRIVVTEMGASTTDGYNLTSQKDWVAHQYWRYDTDDAAVPLSERIDGVMFHETIEDPAPMYGNTWQSGFGFTRNKDATGAYPTKPVFCAFRTMFGGYSDCPAAIVPS